MPPRNVCAPRMAAPSSESARARRSCIVVLLPARGRRGGVDSDQDGRGRANVAADYSPLPRAVKPPVRVVDLRVALPRMVTMRRLGGRREGAAVHGSVLH